jgi:radical SAM protein with 4Fe4S-binding SPASM domain
MIGAKEAARLRRLGIEQVQISIYSDRPEIHDAITKLPGSLRRSLEAIRHLKANGVKVSISNVLMKQNARSGMAVRNLAKEIGVEFHIDPTITPMLNGDRSILNLGISKEELDEVFHTEEFIGDVGEFCAPVATVDEDVLEGYSCSAGHTLAYISPCGNVREKSFRDIWYRSEQLTELRAVQVKHLPTCSGCGHVAYCTRCPGLAYMEGNMRGPSTSDCAKSEARTGIPSAWQVKSGARPGPSLVQIRVA